MEDGTESELISDGFTCAVCLDVLYKPIVLVCGHVSCFWCCQHSMRRSSESHCPLCRHPYHHFPAICLTLHFLLKKLYPISYNRRKIQTLEDEKHTALGCSPDIDSLVTSDEFNNLNNVGQSSDPILEDEFTVCLSTKTNTLSQNFTLTYKQITLDDVLCAVCKQLLFRPVALNCGHVYCEGCITIPTEGMLKCQVCECRHPSGHPKVCREFDHFLEEQLSSEYTLRRSIIQNTSSSYEAKSQISKLSFPTEETFLQWWTANHSEIHGSVGCDMCGIYPIVGDRYKCQDCTEKSGYDLCGDCYNTGSNVPGRFNQKHTPTHRLELVRPTVNRNVMHRLLGRRLAAVSAFASRNQSSPNYTREDQSDNQPPL